MDEVKNNTKEEEVAPKRVQVYIPPEDVKQLKIKMINEYGRSNISELTRNLYKKFLKDEIDVDLDI